MGTDTGEAQLARKIRRTKRVVFLRADFADIGNDDRIGRALGRLVKQGVVIRIGQGVYARAVPTPFDNTPVPTKGVS
jgi:predicted transcriptional regulator of viral defense system